MDVGIGFNAEGRVVMDALSERALSTFMAKYGSARIVCPCAEDVIREFPQDWGYVQMGGADVN